MNNSTCIYIYMYIHVLALVNKTQAVNSCQLLQHAQDGVRIIHVSLYPQYIHA